MYRVSVFLEYDNEIVQKSVYKKMEEQDGYVVKNIEITGQNKLNDMGKK